MAAVLQSASREALAQARGRLDDGIDRSSASELTQLGDDLFAVSRLLDAEVVLRRHLADATVPAASRTNLADRLLDGKVGRAALDVVSDLVSARWSRPGDLVVALRTLGRQATLAVAEKDRSLDEVEDQLFRFGRIVEREPQLGRLLGDRNTPAEKRIGLLRTVLGRKVSTVAATLLEQVVRDPGARGMDLEAEELSELAAARRDRSVAHVSTAVRLSPGQEQRLVDSLTRLYGRPISLQVELDPSLLGGLVVRMGGELIDGSVAGRLAAARRSMPS